MRAAVARAGQRAALPPAALRERPLREARQQAQRGPRCRGPARRSPARGPATRCGRSRSGFDPDVGRSAPVRRAPRRARPPKSRSFRPGSGRSDVSAWESLSAGMALDERVSAEAVSWGENAAARAPRRGPLRSYPPRRLRPRGARRNLLPTDPRTAPGHRQKARRAGRRPWRPRLLRRAGAATSGGRRARPATRPGGAPAPARARALALVLPPAPPFQATLRRGRLRVTARR